MKKNLFKQLLVRVENSDLDLKREDLIQSGAAVFLGGLTIISLIFFVFSVYFFAKEMKIGVEIVPIQVKKNTELESKVREMLAGYPMERMARYIAMEDEKTAAFLVGIAKKESNWGERKPVLNGEDCFNYWGYRGKRERMGSGGHTCFDSPKDAVNTVANRIDSLIYESGLDTPQKLVVWKCGRSCAGHSDYSVQKWISDVNLYYQKFYN